MAGEKKVQVQRSLNSAASGIFLLLLLVFATTVAGNGFCKFDNEDPNLILPSPSSKSQLFIEGGIVVNAESQQVANVYIEDGTVKAIGAGIKVPEGVEVIDASGKYVMPGGIDPHTHFAMPFMGTESADDFYSGQAAALAGGTTMHIDFALPVNGDIMEGYKMYVKKAEISVMDYGFHMAVTTWNDKVAADMAELVAKGINSFKFFMAYKGALQVTDEELLAGFARCKELGALPQVHCENGDAVVYGQKKIYEMGITGPEGHPLSRPAVVEGEATARAIKLAKFVNVPLYVVHVMSIDALDEVARARLAGQRVIGEPVASGLALDGTHVYHADFKYAAQFVMSPPIRSVEHQAALRAALANGILQLVATDHCAFNSTQKARGRHDFRLIPNGVNGVGERMHIVWDTMVNTGLITPSDYVRVTSAACAKIFNVYPQKGAIAVNSDADIIILNPNATTHISAASSFSRMDTNIYEGWTMKGNIEVTISQGRVVYKEGKLFVTPGTGRFIPLKPFNYLYTDLDKLDAAIHASYKAPVVRASE